MVYGFSPFGYEGSLFEVEVDLRRGIPAVDIVGLADATVKEVRERVRSAYNTSGFEFPPERVLVSLSPCDMRKDGVCDVTMAAGILNAQNKFTEENILVLGELETNGNVRGVSGIHAALSTAISCGITKAIIPLDNAQECGGLPIDVCIVKNLLDVRNALELGGYSKVDIKDYESDVIDGVEFSPLEEEQKVIKTRNKKGVRALEIAAAGNHNLLLFGAPGCGKTMITQQFMPLFSPYITEEESQTVTRVHSLAGLLHPTDDLVHQKPFRMPHQTASIEGICGGGSNCRPGEISLAHNGILFLDEAAEFKTSVIQMLRVPLESHSITLSRAGRSTIYPANFQLIMATNPCPCGNYGNPDKICLCSARSIDQYWRKFSSPLLDRVELRVHVLRDEEETPVDIEHERKSIARAIKIQRERGVYNSRMSPQEVALYCKLGKQTQAFLDEKEWSGLSPREIQNLLKVARTIADMNGDLNIRIGHLREAYELHHKTFSLD